jgi:hypothetical protein
MTDGTLSAQATDSWILDLFPMPDALEVAKAKSGSNTALPLPLSE